MERKKGKTEAESGKQCMLLSLVSEPYNGSFM